MFDCADTDIPNPDWPEVAAVEVDGELLLRCPFCHSVHHHGGRYGHRGAGCSWRLRGLHFDYVLRPPRDGEVVDITSPDPDWPEIPDQHVSRFHAGIREGRDPLAWARELIETVRQEEEERRTAEEQEPPLTPEFRLWWRDLAERVTADFSDEEKADIIRQAQKMTDEQIHADQAEQDRAHQERQQHDAARPDNRGRPYVEKPQIILHPGGLDVAADKAENALLKSGLPIFQRGHDLVRPGYSEVQASDGRRVVAPCLTRIEQPGLLDLLCQSAVWQKPPKADGTPVFCDPTDTIARIMLSRFGRWLYPTVAGVISTPTLRPDGTILRQAGYDPATRLFLIPDKSLILPPIPDEPTRAHALAALALLKELLAEFPLVGDVDVAVALSGLLTPVLRAAMTVAPLHAFRAHTAGSGKSFLVDLASTIATGRICPVSPPTTSDEEVEKHLIGLLLAGFPIISLDNIEPTTNLGGGVLCQAVERPSIRIRPLGRSDIMEIAATATCFTTGNNLVVAGDMTRRTVIASLDAKVERPELREFSGNPVHTVMANRGRYVAACLTIARAYLVAGKPGRLNPVASYEQWSDLVRSPLVWLGCADPAESMNTARAEDPKRAALAAVIAAWGNLGIGQEFTTKELITACQFTVEETKTWKKPTPPPAGLRDALATVCEIKGSLDAGKLGYWLRANAGRVVNGLRIERGDKDRLNVATWRLIRVH